MLQSTTPLSKIRPVNPEQDSLVKINLIPYSCLNFNKFVVLRVSFADEKSQKSPQVKTLNAGIFLGGCLPSFFFY